MISAKIYPLTLAAGASFTLQATGDYFKVLRASGPVEVRGNTFGSLGELQAGQGLDRTPFQALTLRDVSGASNTLRIVVAGEDFVDDRISGEVSVIDGSKARTLAGAVFGFRGRLTSSAGNYSQVQLWNPAGSGKRLIVSSYHANTSGANGTVLTMGTAALPTAFSAVPGSKLAGGPASVGQQRWEQSAAFAASSATITQIISNAQQSDPEPIVVLPGYGLNFATSDLAADLLACCHFIEESL